MTFADGPVLNKSPETYSKLESVLLNASGKVTLAERFRALFTLKALADNQAVDIIAKGKSKRFEDPSDLLRHELAYVLGQTKNVHAIPYLNDILNNKSEAPMVRHEAAEALGAIGEESSLTILKDHLNDPNPVISQTCELAISRIQQDPHAFTPQQQNENPYTSIDPAPASKISNVDELKKLLVDESKPLYERYKAMFKLRNLNTTESVLALAEGFSDSSALFRHEIAYVFGQMQNEASVPALITQLQKESEEAMVRHECAEALGSIATPECYEVLKAYAQDAQPVVRESCVVGLDMADYESDPKNFEYALSTTDL